jgi:membrane protein involved in colicin uptake
MIEMSKDYRAMATKEITPTMAAFADWLKAETGVDVDARSVALAGSLRMDFQKSEFWKNDERNYLSNVEANRATKAIEAAEKAQNAAKKAQERVAATKAKADAAIAAAKKVAEDAAAKAAAKNEPAKAGSSK